MVWKSNCTFPKTQPPIDRCRLTSNFEHCYHFRHNCWLTSSESRSPDSHFSTFLNGTSRVEIFKEKKSTIFGLKIKKKILASSWCDEWPSVGRSIIFQNIREVFAREKIYLHNSEAMPQETWWSRKMPLWKGGIRKVMGEKVRNKRRKTWGRGWGGGKE